MEGALVRRGLWISCLLLALAGSLCAQESGEVWVRDLEAGLTRARYSGRATVLVFSAHWCGYCEQLEAFFADARVAPIRRKTVLILIDVDRHPDLLRQYNVTGHHKAVVLSWDKVELARLELTDKPEKLLDAFRSAVCANDIGTAEVLFGLGHTRKAAERAGEVRELLKEGVFAERAGKLLEEIRKKAQEELKTADELLKTGRLGDCALACDHILDAFPAKLVAGRVAKLRRDIRRVSRGGRVPGEAPAEPVEVTPARRAQELVDRAMVAEWDKGYAEAVGLYERVLREFAGQPAAEEARSRLKSLAANPATAELIRQQKVERAGRALCQMARAYAAAGHPAEARKRYREVMETCPGSAWAATAADELKELPGR